MKNKQPKTIGQKLKSVCLSFLSFLILNTCLLALPQASYAQTLSLSLWPPLLEIMIQPGRTTRQAYKLTNNSDRPLKVIPQIYSFSPQGENGQTKINYQTEEPGFFSLENNLKIGEPFTIEVGETTEIVLKIKIPANSTEADYYYTLLFSTQTESEIGQTQTTATTQIGSHILLTISKTGELPLLARIIDFSAPPIVDSFSPVEFTLHLENWGKAFWKPFGKITLKGLLNQREEIKLLEQNILSKSSRKLSLPPIKPKLPLGPFKARLEFSPNENGQILSSEITFWYLPYKVLGGLLALLLFGWLLKKYVTRKTKGLKNKPK
jgi:hypothetical protein